MRDLPASLDELYFQIDARRNIITIDSTDHRFTRDLFRSSIEDLSDSGAVFLVGDLEQETRHLTLAGLDVWKLALVCTKSEARRALTSHPKFGGKDDTAKAKYRNASLAVIRASLGVDTNAEVISVIRRLHDAVGAPWRTSDLVDRGDYVKACAILRARTRGLSLNVPWWRDVLTRREAIRASLGDSLTPIYGRPLYIDGAFSHANFSALIEERGWSWSRTKAGPELSSDYLSDRLKALPELRPLKEVRDAMSALQSVILNWDADGWCQCGSTSFWTATGRNQPWVRDGFVMNMHPGFRVGGIEVRDGMALIAADYSKQEPAIGIALSGDERFARLYLTGDLYETFGSVAGVDRPSAKSGVLGINYGMGLIALTSKIYADLGDITRHEAERLATIIKGAFDRECAIYSAYLDAEAKRAADRGWCESVDGWIVFTSPNFSRKTQLRNFPIQSAGAAMLRRAIITLARETSIDIPFTLHDAIYANAPIGEAEETAAIVAEHMESARAHILRNAPLDMPIEVEPKIFTHQSGIVDGRGDKLLKIIGSANSTIN